MMDGDHGKYCPVCQMEIDAVKDGAAYQVVSGCRIGSK